MPQRIQRRRTSHWHMPLGAIYVGRPTIFGNCYDQETFGRRLAVDLFALTARGCWMPQLLKGHPDEVAQAAYHAHCAWLERIGPDPVGTIRSMLRGHDLACWCDASPNNASIRCHADILLAIANEGSPPDGHPG